MTASISFLTAFLTLVKGPHPVELAVQGPVATIEIRLDHREITTLRRPPWMTTCHLGATIVPHRLEAVARNSDGIVVARAEQLINVRQTRAQAQLLMHSDATGKFTGGQLRWNHALNASPSRITVRLDNRVLELDEDAQFTLDEASQHSTRIVSAELEFPDRETARTAVAIGHGASGSVESRLTAAPIVLPKQHSKLDLADLQGTIRVPTGEARVVAIDNSAARIFLIEDCTATPHLRRAKATAGRSKGWKHNLVLDARIAGERDGDKPQLRVVGTVPEHRRGQIFHTISDGFVLSRRPLPFFASLQNERLSPHQSLASATAIAAAEAARTGRPRAVVLLLGAGTDNGAGCNPEEVIAYMHALRVPFFVWRSDPRPPSLESRRWGPGTAASTLPELLANSTSVRKRAGRQRIVWIEGAWLPNEITLENPPDGVMLAGTSDRSHL